MENKILEFKKKVRDSKKACEFNEKLYKDNSHFCLTHGLDFYNFYVCYDRITPGIITLGANVNNSALIKLDEEDINYFKNKYFPKLEKEMEDKIANIKEEYEK